MSSEETKNGSLSLTIPFRQIWCVDFEFQTGGGNRPQPICMVAKEITSGQTIRLWKNELDTMCRAPFGLGEDIVVVAYMAAAEMGCFLELGWRLPEHVLDLFVEHRVETNGRHLETKDSLLGALALRGIPHIEAGHKDAMRSLILERSTWSTDEQAEILNYCESDVDGLADLLRAMAASIDWPRALLRGRYMSAVARMERSGVPVDAELYRTFIEQWPNVQDRLIEEIDPDYGVYEGGSFKANRFAKFLAAVNIPWPRLPSGALELKDDTFKEQARLYPKLGPLHELRQSLSKLRKSTIEIGVDGRARTSLRPFRAKTGRNQPAASKYAFGPSKWLRGIIRPEKGFGIAYIDFVSQEIGIAAGLSGDQRLIDAYMDGDVYMAFARQSGIAPPDATKVSHPLIRERCKAVVLGLNYGMGAEGMALRAGITVSEARELIQLHKQVYSQFWKYSGDLVDRALISNRISTVFGWHRSIKSTDKTTSLMNFPMQANGAEMMRIAAIAATEAGIEVCAPIHDAFLISAPIERLDEDVRVMSEVMSKAGASVTGGLSIRTEANVIRYPDRYMDDKGSAMWNRVVRLIGRPDAAYRALL